MHAERIASIMQCVADDMQKDAYSLDGMPFDGRTVATQFGNNCAAIHAIALAVKQLAEMQVQKGLAKEPKNDEAGS